MKKFILILFVVLIAAFVILNYIAANEAEHRIDKAIQGRADSSSVSVQYSSVDVSPFSGNIEFSNVTIVQKANIQRAQNILVDLRYLDFLNIIFGGVQYGLEQLNNGDVELKNVSYINRGTMKQFSVKHADLQYRGNLWDGIRALYANHPRAFHHQLDATGSTFSYTKSASAVGAFKSDSVFLHFNWPKAAAEAQATDSLAWKNTTWTPPSNFQQKYAFFIQGFGYKLDSIPISTMGFSSSNFSQKRIQINNGNLKTDLFTIQFDGTVVRDSTWSDARLAPLRVSFTDLSQKFKSVLQNVEQMLGTHLQQQQNKINFQLRGPFSNPRIVPNNQL